MLRYVAGRFLQSVLNMLFVATLVFALVRLTGDPATVLVPESAPQSVITQVRTSFGLNRPLYIQYFRYLDQLVHFNFGTSFATGQSVNSLVWAGFEATLLLSLAALIIAVLVALPLGVLSAVYRGSLVDTFARAVALLGQSAPAFYVSIIFVLVFGVKLRVLPVSGRSGLESYVLPGIALGWAAMAGVVRLTRASMLDVLESDFVRMARAKGLPRMTITVRHALRNALIPVTTYLGLVLGGFLGGAVVIESIFDWQGIGQTSLQAVQARDFPVVQGAVIMIAAAFIVVNFLVDMLYVVIDPRIRYRSRGRN